MPRKINDPLDSTPFTIGLITILKQYHSEYTEDFIALIGQYARSTTESSAAKYAYLIILPNFISYYNYALIMFAYFIPCCNYVSLWLCTL